MILHSCKKSYNNETQRTVPPEETLARVEKALPAAGITQVIDITDLDRLGIPVFVSLRPTAHSGAVTLHNGKGATPVEAHVSAIMEGIERFSAENNDNSLKIERYSNISMEMPALDPQDLILPRHADPDMPIPWVTGNDLTTEEEIAVPASAVFHPLSMEYPQLLRTHTNGIASGNSLEEAVFHALMEVIERDAWSLVEMTRDTGPEVVGITDPLACDLLEKFSSAGVEVHIKNITSENGIPTFAAVSDDLLLKDPSLLTIGMGTHTSARIALLRALTEVAQSRLTQIYHVKKNPASVDIKNRMGYERTRRMNRYWFESRSEVDFSDIPSFDSDDFLKDIRLSMETLSRSGLSRVILVNLTREEVGVPVVRVIVPGLEVYTMDQERIGPRCQEARKRRDSQARAG
jgi:putative methanogenesis marker protein 1